MSRCEMRNETQEIADSKSYFVYVLRCSDDSFYTGYTTDVNRRIETHNAGKGAKYTRSKRPVSLECFWECPDLSSALRLEKKFKTLTRAQKERLLRSAPNYDDVMTRLFP